MYTLHSRIHLSGKFTLWDIWILLVSKTIIISPFPISLGFPDSSVGKESTCNAGDPSSIPGLGKFTEEGIGYPRQYSWVSLLDQLVKNTPAMHETWVWSLGWEDSPGKGMAIHPRILAWEIPQSLVGYSPRSRRKSDTTELLTLSLSRNE